MKSSSQLKGHSLGMIALLVVEYILGMTVNLYVEFPDSDTAAGHWEFVRGQWLVLAHIIVGALIVLGMIALYVRAIKLKDKTWKIAGGIATGSAILAFICGEEFISTQQDVLSLAMSLFFLLALVSLGWGVYKTGK